MGLVLSFFTVRFSQLGIFCILIIQEFVIEQNLIKSYEKKKKKKKQVSNVKFFRISTFIYDAVML